MFRKPTAACQTDHRSSGRRRQRSMAQRYVDGSIERRALLPRNNVCRDTQCEARGSAPGRRAADVAWGRCGLGLGSRGVGNDMARRDPSGEILSRPARPVVALCYGIVCHACFVLGVGAMMAAMFFGMSRSLGVLPAPWRWPVNALLLVQFPVVHSLLLTKRGRALLARLAPGGTGATLSSTTYATIASLQVLALFALWTPGGEIWWRPHGAAFLAMTMLYAASWLLLGKAMFDASLV